MHAKTDSDGTSLDNSWLPRSPRRPLYYVQSPSNHDAEKMSYGSSPTVSPAHLYYHSSPIHHSRESSASIFSNSLKIPRSLSAWKHIRIGNQDGAVHDGAEGDKDGDDWGSGARNVRLYFIGFLFFVLLFTVFCLILWGASKAYEPEISVKVSLFSSKYLPSWLGGSLPCQITSQFLYVLWGKWNSWWWWAQGYYKCGLGSDCCF